MAEEFRIVERWPDLFEGVSASDIEDIVQAFASAFQEGWVPNRPDVEDLVAFHTRRIDFDEYENRSRSLVERNLGIAD